MEKKKLLEELNQLEKQIVSLTIELDTLRNSRLNKNDRIENNSEISEKIKQLEIEISRIGGFKEEIEFSLKKLGPIQQ